MLIDFDVIGEDRVAADLLRFSDRADDMRPALLGVAADMRDQVGQRFDDEGPGWAPLAASTRAAKGNDAILYETGDLSASLTDESQPGGFAIATHDTLHYGSSVPYAGYHQRGTERMPKRKILDFGPEDRRTHIRTLQRYLVEGVSIGLFA